MYCLDVDYQLSSRCFANADCSDWDMKDGRISKDILCGELIAGKHNIGHLNYAIRMCASETWISTWTNENNSSWTVRSYLQVALKNGAQDIIIALGKRKLQKDRKIKTTNLMINDTRTNGHDP